MNSISILKRFAGWPGPVGCVLVTCAIFIGATCVVGFADEPTSQPKPFEQCTLSELAVLAEQLRAAGPQGQPQLEALVQYARTTYMSAPATGASGQPKWREWAAVIGQVGGQFSTADRERIASEMESGIPAIPGGVAGLSFSEIHAVSRAIYVLGRRNTGRSIASAWVNGSDKYQAVALGELVKLLPQLENMPKEMQAQRDQAMGRLAERVAAEVFSSQSRLAASSERTWCLFTVHLAYAGALSDERRASWSEILRQAFAATDEQVLQTEAGRMWRLGRALNALKDENGKTLVVDWTKNTTKWQSMSTIQMQWLIEQLEQAGDLGAQQQLRVLEHVSAEWLADNLKARSISLGAWQGFSASAARVLSASRKVQWADRLQQVFLNDSQGLAFLRSVSDIESLSGALASLGDERAKTTLVTFVEKTVAWKSWSPDDIAGLATSLTRLGASGASVAKVVAATVTSKYASAEGARLLTPGQWNNLAGALGRDLSKETKAQWAAGVIQAFAGSGASIAALPTEEVKRLVDIMRLLGAGSDLVLASGASDGGVGMNPALAWLKNRDAWQGASIETLTNLAVAAHRVNPKETLPILGDLDKFCVARHATQPLTLDECLALRGMHLKVGQLPKAQQWVLVGCDVTIGTEALRAAADQATVVKLSLALVDTAMVGPTKDCSKFAATVAAVASRGALEFRAGWEPLCIGEALGAAETRQIVRDALLDAQGNPRLGLAKVLACTYKQWGGLDEWRAHVDQQVSAAPANSDKKALWQLVLGYTKSVTPEKPDVLQLRPGVTAALASAATDQVRVIAWRELADMYVSINRPGVAAQMLESVKGQFTGDSLAAIDSMQKDLQMKEAARLKRAAP